MNKPILSIGILVSGPYYQVKKTIDSLAPIRRALPCQLIVTDTRPEPSGTGSVAHFSGDEPSGTGLMAHFSHDELTAYLKKEADVYDTFTWINDFAAARNANLAHATGKWYLYLDDDEVITEGVADFVAFFNGNEVDDYDSGEYIQRNHRDRSGTNYQDYYVQRIKRLTPDAKFCSRIHEYMVPYPDRVVVFNLVADHYGYVYDSEEERLAHKKRNVDLLLALRDDEPENLRCRQQLLLETVQDPDYHAFTDMALENLDHIGEKRESHEIPMIWDLYGGAVYGLVRLLLLPDREDKEVAAAWHYESLSAEAEPMTICAADVLAKLEAVCKRMLADSDSGNLCKATAERGLAICYAYAGRPEEAAAARGRYETYRQAALADPNALHREETASFIKLAEKNPFAGRETPVLSIGMLVSDSKHTARAAIRALRYLRSVLPCELILTDTRPQRETSEEGANLTAFLIEEAVHYHTFTWCNDFAAARNANLGHATGDWYMFLDDDELLTDVSNLVGFFESGAYRDVDAGDIVIRSYDDYERSGYSDAWLTRLRKRTDALHFEDCIHEHFEPRPKMEQRIGVIADHFGYVFADEEAKLAHSKRNCDLLRSMLAKDPNNLRTREQMLLEYETLGDYEGLFAFSQESLEISKDMNGRYEIPCVWAYAAAGAKALSELDDADALETWCRERLADKRLGTMCRGYLMAVLAELCFSEKRYEAALPLIEAYEEAYAGEDPGSDYFHMEEGVPFIGVAFSEGWRSQIGKMKEESKNLLDMKAQLLSRIEMLEDAGQKEVAQTLRVQLSQLFRD